MMLQTFWIIACVALDREIPPDPDDPEDDDPPIVGYYRNFGVSAASEEEARRLVTADVPDGEIDWAESTICPRDIETLHPDIIARSGDWTEMGIWYKSGRALFPADS